MSAEDFALLGSICCYVVLSKHKLKLHILSMLFFKPGFIWNGSCFKWNGNFLVMYLTLWNYRVRSFLAPTIGSTA